MTSELSLVVILKTEKGDPLTASSITTTITIREVWQTEIMVTIVMERTPKMQRMCGVWRGGREGEESGERRV